MLSVLRFTPLHLNLLGEHKKITLFFFVKMSSAHSICSKSYVTQTKADNKFPDMTTYTLSKHIKEDSVPRMPSLNKKQSLYRFATYIKGTLENYWASADREITSEHVPRRLRSDAFRMFTDVLAETEDSEVRMFALILAVSSPI